MANFGLQSTLLFFTMQDNHKRFADKYFETLNATKSAIYAGFSEDTAKQQGWQLLQREDVQTYIAEMREEYARNAGVSKEWIIERFKHISDACVTATPVMEFDPVNKCLVQKTDEFGNGVYEFDSSGANKATEMLGKIIGVFEKDNSQKKPETPSLTVTIARPTDTDE